MTKCFFKYNVQSHYRIQNSSHLLDFVGRLAVSSLYLVSHLLQIQMLSVCLQASFWFRRNIFHVNAFGDFLNFYRKILKPTEIRKTGNLNFLELNALILKLLCDKFEEIP